jgi:hypothetical protein
MNAIDLSPYTATLNDTAAPITAKVAAAAALWALIESAQEALEPFKREVRALAVASGESVVTLDGDGLTQAKVVVPGPSLKLTPAATVEGERLALGVLFNSIYEVKLSLRKADPTFIGTFPPEVQAHLAGVTDLVPNTPRVSLKSLPGVTPV